MRERERKRGRERERERKEENNSESRSDHHMETKHRIKRVKMGLEMLRKNFVQRRSLQKHQDLYFMIVESSTEQSSAVQSRAVQCRAVVYCAAMTRRKRKVIAQEK